MSESWSLYDRLIGGIPQHLTVDSYLIGSTWTLVDSGGLGMAMTYRGGAFNGKSGPSYSGRPLAEVANEVKDWSLDRASVGMAAINAYYNRPDMVQAWVNKPLQELRSPGAFEAMLPDMAGKKVAVIGHFPGMETLAQMARLSVLERNPQPGDLPDFAADYVLPEQDFVLITGTTITNKTLPGLLRACSQAYVALVGPSLTFAPWWFDHGVDLLAGAVVTDKASVWRATAEGAHRQIFDYGATMINIRRRDLV